MNDAQLELIYKIIANGAPALAQELCTCLDNLVLEYKRLSAECSELKNKYENAKKGGDK